jgi:hypothetical protein
VQAPSAPHTYFKIHNLDEARRDFLLAPTESPTLVYRSTDYEALRGQIEDLEPGTRQRLSLELVDASMLLRASATEQHLAHFRALNQELYGEPDRIYAEAILGRSIRKATGIYDDIAQYISKAVPSADATADLYAPSTELFERLRSYLIRYTNFEQMDTQKSLPELLEAALQQSGLSALGWIVRLTDDAHHASTVHHNKRVRIGKDYLPRSVTRKRQIVMHEVYGHALRGQQGDVNESEGFAILLEQLVFERYSSRRTYRFLAAALGWGSVDHPRNFIDTYEILWRVIVSGGHYDETDAKAHAFSECLRVFRGGKPDIPGAVFLKDSLYFKANLAIWQRFEQMTPSYEDFVDFIEGKRKVLI